MKLKNAEKYRYPKKLQKFSIHKPLKYLRIQNLSGFSSHTPKCEIFGSKNLNPKY